MPTDAQPTGRAPERFHLMSDGDADQGHVGDDGDGDDWIPGGPSRRQRRRLRRQQQRQQQQRQQQLQQPQQHQPPQQSQGQAPQGRDEPTLAGGAPAGRTDSTGDEHHGAPAAAAAASEGQPGSRPQAAVLPFVDPPFSRKICAARSQIIKAHIDELQDQGATRGTIEQWQRDLAEAERWTREAGGQTAGRLRMEILSQSRKNAKRREAVEKAVKGLADFRRKRDDAARALQEAEASVEVLRKQADYGERRYTWLVAQQAAEARPQEESKAVRDALGALRQLGDLVPQEARGPLEVAARVLSQLCLSGLEGEALESAGLFPSSDVEFSEDEGDYVDDEAEVGGALGEWVQAKEEQLAIKGERKKALMDSVAAGSESVDAIIKRYATKTKAATERRAKARAALDGARAAARRRLAQPRQQQTEGHGGAEDDLVPCPPPAKWRRGGSCGDSEDSEATIDETPVIAMPLPASAAGALASDAASGRQQLSAARSPPHQHQQQAEQQQQPQRQQHQMQLEQQVQQQERHELQQQPQQRQQQQQLDEAACTTLADGAVQVAQAAAAAASAASAARTAHGDTAGPSQRCGREPSAASGRSRARPSSCGAAPERERSKTPKRQPRSVAMDQD